MKKLYSILALPFLFCATTFAQTPPQVINKLCAANTFFSQIQPGPNNIQCTQPSYSGLSNLPNFIRSIQFTGGSVSLLGDALSPGNTKYYGTDGAGTKGYFSFPSSVSAIGTIDSATASANGAVVSGANLIMQSASTTRPGLVNISAQSFSGDKTFTGNILAFNLDGTNTGDVDLGTANGLSIIDQTLSLGLSSSTTTGALSSSDWIAFAAKQDDLTFTAPLINTADTISCRAATGSVSGCLSSTDWNTFNGKQSALTFGNLSDAGTDGILVTNGNGSVIGSGTSIAQHVSDATHNGYLGSADWTTFDDKQDALTFTAPLINTTDTITCRVSSTSVSGCLSSTDWNTFNGKQAAGNYLTALTGDGTASGPGSAALTLATINSNVGSFGGATAVSTFTVNGKGLLTAAGSTSIQIAESQVTNLVSDLAGKQPTGSYITSLTGDVSAAGPGAAATTIQANVVDNTKLAQMAAHTVKANTTGSTANASDASLGTVTEATSSVLTLTGWSNATVGSPTILVKTASTSQSGYLTSTDWNTFNGKQAAGSYLTALTGDGTASGPGSAALTLATVNSNVGSFGSSTSIPSFTVNGKGLVTAASGNVVIAPAGTLTGTTLNGTVVTSSLTSVGTLTSGTWSATTIAVNKGGTGVTSVTTAPTASSFAGWDANSSLSANNFIAGYATTATAAGTTTLTVSSAQQQYFTGALAQIVALPAVSTLVLGQSFLIVNNSIGLVTVNSSGGNALQIMAGSTQLIATVVSTSGTGTSSWSWEYNLESPVNAITALTGDGTASGPGSAAFTLATVNSNVGSFGGATTSGTFTVNGKGLITAASSTSIQIAESQVTNLVSDLAGKQATGNYITALTGDLTASGPGSVAGTLATVNTNTGSFGSSTAIPNFTVNGKGLLTAAGTSVVIAPAGTLTGTTLASNVVTSSLTTVGTIGSGTWAGTTITPDHGGTGVANNASSTLTISGSFGTTFTVGATTSVTLPASGTLAPGLNWASYTPTVVGLGSISNVSVFWRREGDSVRVRGSFTCGTTTGVATTISLPSGANTIDTTKTPVDQTAFLGTFYRAAGGGSIPGVSVGAFPITAVVGTSTSLVFLSQSTNSATPGFQTTIGTNVANSTDRIMFDFTVPVTQYAY